MSNVKIPEGMLDAAWNTQAAFGVKEGIRKVLESAVRWLYDELDSLEHEPYNDVLAHEYNDCLADVRRIFLAPDTIDDRDMIVYDCLECNKLWKQQLREEVASCVYCGSTNTKSIATGSSVKDYPIHEQRKRMTIGDLTIADLLWKVGDREDIEHNSAVSKAFNRGFRMGEQQDERNSCSGSFGGKDVSN